MDSKSPLLELLVSVFSAVWKESLCFCKKKFICLILKVYSHAALILTVFLNSTPIFDSETSLLTTASGSFSAGAFFWNKHKGVRFLVSSISCWILQSNFYRITKSNCKVCSRFATGQNIFDARLPHSQRIAQTWALSADNNQNVNSCYIFLGCHMLAEYDSFWPTNNKCEQAGWFFLRCGCNFLIPTFLVLAYLNWTLRLYL